MGDIADKAILRVVATLLFPDSVVAQNVFYVMFNDDGTSADEEDVLDDLVDWIEGAYDTIKTYLVSAITMDDIHVYVRDTGENDWDEVGVKDVNVTMSGGSDMIPHGVAALLHMGTTDADVTGSKFIGGIIDNSLTTSDFTSGVLTALALWGLEWVGNFVGTATAATFNPGVFSVAKNAFFVSDQIGLLNAQCAYQRRRKPGVGI